MLTDAGIRGCVALAPVLPGLTDAPEQLAAVMRAARDAGAAGMWWNILNLRPGTRDHFFRVLEREWPEQLDRYQRLYAGSGYLRAADAAPIQERLKVLRAGVDMADRRRIRLTPEPDPEQLALTF